MNGLQAVEETLTTLHLQNRPPRRPAGGSGPTQLPAKERAVLAREAFAAAMPEISVFKRAARSRARAVAETEANGFARAVDVAHGVITQHRAALLDDEWDALASHDRCAVIAELDAEFAATECDCTCVDAGRDAQTSRAYVTVVAHYPGLEIAGDRGPGVSGNGRPMLRRRTRSERNAVYLRALASFAIATARRAISVAVAADDIHLVIVRPSQGGEGPEPIYVGTLSREAVTLRPSLADPVPLLLGCAAYPLQFDGPAHDLLALAPDPAVLELVGLCAEALGGSRADGSLEGGAN
ncbi:hypothetical protein [Terrabacter sp. BE26]|uniref:hypothetical protein n=1 Tax=Terrabacter sp. BE26 TaxID=2898152 RepID=UPI0035BE465D